MKNPRATRIEKFFAGIAPVYDFFVGPAMRAKARAAADLFGPVAGLRALDLCTGTGILALELAARGARVTGVDFSPAMLARAQKKAAGRGVVFRLADASALDFADRSFDISTIAMALHEMPLPVRRRVLEEMRRVTRDRALVMDWIKPSAQPLWRLGVSLVERLEGGFYHEFIRNDLRALLLDTGFQLLACTELDTIGIFLLSTAHHGE